MTNPSLIPSDMRKRAESLHKRAAILHAASTMWQSRVDEPRALDLAQVLADHALELELIAELLESWADGIG